MNTIYLKNIKIIDPSSAWNGNKVNILIEDGIIKTISDNKTESFLASQVVQGDNLMVSKGWTDLRANFCDPGYEYKEDLVSGAEAAAYGGFTGVALLPETDPVLASKSAIEYILSKAANGIVDIYPLAAISSGKEEDNLTEMFDVHEAGAAGFSSGYSPVKDGGFLLRAMEYAGMTGLPLMVRPENLGISGKGQVNEGVVSVRLGLKGAPTIAEEADINTILHLCEYTGQPVHISCVSTKQGMEAIEKAHQAGLPVSADVCIHNLYYEEEDLGMFNTMLKLRPPLRTKKDRDYLREAVLKNDYICVVSDHRPQDEDKKKCEFELASYGAIGLQTLFSQMIGIYGADHIVQIAEILADRPAKTLKLENSGIKEGSYARLTVFDPDIKWILDPGTNKSRSENSPLWNEELTGKAIAVINKGKLKTLDNE